MGSSIPAGPAEQAPESVGRRPPRIKRKRRIRPATRYSLIFAALVAIAVLIQFAVHMARTDPRDSRVIAERELELNTLRAGEHVMRAVSVFKRPAISYFRATRGLLVLTNQRLLYLGLEPRDLLAAPDLPPTFEQRDFALDTSVHVSSGRTFFGIAKAVVIETPGEKLRLGVPSGAWPQANLVIVAMTGRRATALAMSKQEMQSRAKAEAQRKAAEIARRKPKYYTVRRGDALGNIATIWNTTPDKLREWNKLPDNKIRIGQTLMVRPAL
jgi:LysM repeat protein